MIRIYLFALVFCVASVLSAAEYQTHELKQQSLVVHTNQGKVSLTAYSSHAVEVWYQPAGLSQLPSYAIVIAFTYPSAASTV